MPDKIVNHFVLADGSTAKLSFNATSGLVDYIGQFGERSFTTVANTTHTQALDSIDITLPQGQKYYLEITASESVSVQLVETDSNGGTSSQSTFTATSSTVHKTYTAKRDVSKVGLYIYKPASAINVNYKVYSLDGKVFDAISSVDDVVVKYPFQSCASDYFCSFDTTNHKITFGTTCRFVGDGSLVTVADGLELTYTGASGIRYVVYNGSSLSVVTSVTSAHTVLFVFYAQIDSLPNMCTLGKPYLVNGVLFNPYSVDGRINYTGDVCERVFIQNKNNLVINGNGYTIDLGKHLTGTVSNGYVTIPYTANTTDHIYKVCFSKTENVLADSNSLSVGYNCTLWAIYDDHTLDFKLVPVTSMENLEATQNSFFYDGTNILINIENQATEYVLADDSSSGGYGLRFANCSGVVSHLTVKYARQACALLNNSVMTFNSCRFLYSAIDSGFTELNGSTAILNNCEAFKARYDGFGNRAGVAIPSDMILNNCHAHYCYDDGISHHNGNFYVNGGEFDHNHKGGISSPTYGAQGSISNALIRNNEQYGIYADNTNDGEITTVMVNNCLFSGNNRNYFIHRYNIVAVNCVYADTPPEQNLINGGSLVDY